MTNNNIIIIIFAFDARVERFPLLFKTFDDQIEKYRAYFTVFDTRLLMSS